MEENVQIDHAGAPEHRRGGSVQAGAPRKQMASRKQQANHPASSRSSMPIPAPGAAVIGYASCVHAVGADAQELKQQADLIARECEGLGLVLTEVVAEREPANSKALGRPGLAYALERIKAGEASGLVVAELSRITHSAGELGTVMEWLGDLNVRLIAANHALDTDREDGRLAAGLLIEVSRWERTRISDRTRNGLQAARMRGKSAGRPTVVDDPDLSQRIAQMRAHGMTLQAIADRLNEEGVPTVRGGAKWRHSSVQAAAGYHRRRHTLRSSLLVQAAASTSEAGSA